MTLWKGGERDHPNEHARPGIVRVGTERLPHNPQQNSKQDPAHRRRYSADAWNCIRGQIDREHRTIALADPRSPRIKPSLAPIGWGLVS
jgi:hypothetical protein